MQNIFDFSSIITVVAFGVFVTVFIYGFSLYFAHLRQPKTYTQLIHGNTNLEEITAMNNFAQLEKKLKLTHKTTLRGGVILKPFLEGLKILFPNQEVLYSKDLVDLQDEKNTSTMLNKIFIKITHKDESVILSGDVDTSYNYNPSTETNEEEFTILNYMYIMHSNRTKFKFDSIIQLMRNTKYTRIEPPKYVARDVAFDVNIITKNRDGYSTSVVRSHSKIKTDEELSIMYEAVDIEVKGKKYQIGLNKLLPVLIQAIKAKHNVYIMGSVGTGKTVLGSYISYILTKENIGKLFYLNSSTIETTLSPEFESAALNIFNCTINDGALDTEESAQKPVNIIILDEAQIALKEDTATSDMMLSLLDGYKKQLYNTVYICLFNEQQAKINPAAFRSGRVDIQIHLKALSKTTAEKVVTNIKSTIDNVVEEFDDTKFKTTLNSVNTLPNAKEPYAKQGEITLADVHGCVVSKSLLDALEETLQKEPVKKEKVVLELKTK